MMIFMFYQVEEFDMGNKLFGTDGVRGVANVYPMTAEFALKLGMAAGQLICLLYTSPSPRDGTETRCCSDAGGDHADAVAGC